MRRMMTLALVVGLAGVGAMTGHAQDSATAEKEAVRAAAMDYLDALYQQSRN